MVSKEYSGDIAHIDGMDTAPVIPAVRSMNMCVEEYLDRHRIANHTPATIRTYRYWLDQLTEDLPDAAAVNSLTLSRFLTRVRERGLKPSSVNQAYRCLKAFVSWLRRQGAIDGDPMADIPRPKIPKTNPQVPTVEDLKALTQ